MIEDQDMYMNIKNIGVLFILLFSLNISSAQKVTEDRIEKIINELKAEARDSIANLSKECDVKREIMLKVIKEKGFDEEFIIGPDLKYFNEGMSAYFVKVPKPMFPIFPDRDKKVVLLENTHVELFHLDLKLSISKSILNKLDSVDVEELYNDILSSGDSMSDLTLKRIIAYNIVEDATKNIKFSKISKKNIDRDINVISVCDEDYNYKERKKPYIEASYPYDGQYNVHINEEKENSDFGFLKIGGDFDWRFYREDSVLVVLFTNTAGDYKIVDVRYKFFTKTFTFSLPHDFLKRGEIYKLQLALRPLIKGNYSKSFNNASIQELVKNNYYNLFRVLEFNVNKSDLKNITTFYKPIYFRTSIFPSKTEKLNNAKIVIGKDPFVIKFKLKEPFDDFELNGTKCDNPVISFNPPSFSYYSYWDKMNNIYSKRTAYYLTVPQLEQVDVSDYKKNYAALLDHTFEAENIINANNSLAEKYIKDRESFFGMDFSLIVKTKIEQNKKVKAITEEDFKRGRVKKKNNVVLTVTIPRFQKMNKNYPKLIKKLKSRKKKRAKFYYKLYLVDAKRKNIKPKYDLQYFLDREDKIISSLIGTDLEKFKPVDLLKAKEKLNFRSIIPYTKLPDYNITLSIDYSKFK